jgi:hypothetical protein
MTQVPPRHYDAERYDKLHRWISYWYQAQSVIRSGARDVLELGCGGKVFSNYLRQRLGLSVTTFDFDPALEPDVIGDVRSLADYFQPGSFDAVCAFQILEHLPFENFAPILTQMASISRRSVLISLPHWGYFVQLRFWLKRWQFVFGRKITRPFHWEYDGQHYWEIGVRGHSLRSVLQCIQPILDVEKHYFCPDYPYHYFFECRVKA